MVTAYNLHASCRDHCNITFSTDTDSPVSMCRDVRRPSSWKEPQVTRSKVRSLSIYGNVFQQAFLLYLSKSYAS